MPDANRYLQSNLPPAFCEATVELLFEVYKKAYEEAYLHYDPKVARTQVGYIRYGMLETAWPRVGRRFGLQMEYKPNSNGGWYHAEVDNTSLVLTQSRVRYPQQIVKKGEFRKSLATGSPIQLELLRDVEKEIEAEQRRIYAVLLHGSEKNRPDRPSFAQFVIPCSQFETYLGKLDIFRLCADKVRQLQGPDIEKIIPTVKPIIKPELPREKEGSIE